MKTTLNVNGEDRAIEADPRTTLLDALRHHIGLTGTKKGCDHGQCGACTVHVDGNPIRSCSTPFSAVEGKEITTIEGLAPSSEELHPLQTAWIEHQVPQCGYCQSGQLMSAAALLASNPNPDDAAIDSAMRGNICRCGMYGRIRQAIKTSATYYEVASTSELTAIAQEVSGE